MRAFYSQMQVRYTGIIEWRKKDGTTVQCTQVGDESPSWPDTVDLGEVESFVRTVLKPTVKDRRRFREYRT